MLLENNCECGAYWVASLDKWLTPVELVAKFNEFNEDYAKLLIKHSTAINHADDLLNDLIQSIEVNKTLTKKVEHLEKRVRILNDVIDNASIVLQGGV